MQWKYIWERDYWPVWALPNSKQCDHFTVRLRDDYIKAVDEVNSLRDRLAMSEKTNRALRDQLRQN